MLKVDNIEKTVINGIRYKIVTVCAFIDDVWFCLGDYNVPARCGNKNLIEWITNN